MERLTSVVEPGRGTLLLNILIKIRLHSILGIVIDKAIDFIQSTMAFYIFKDTHRSEVVATAPICIKMSLT